jgi:hypothetical protein
MQLQYLGFSGTLCDTHYEGVQCHEETGLINYNEQSLTFSELTAKLLSR